MICCNKSTFYRKIDVFIVVSCDVVHHLNSVRTIRYFSVYATFPRRMFMSCENLRSSRTRRYDFTSVKRGDSVGRHFHYKDGRFWVDQAARMPLEYVCETLVKGGCLTSNSKYIHQTVHFDDSWQYRNAFSCSFFRIRKLANIEILRLQYYGIQNALRNIYNAYAILIIYL